MGGWVDGDAQGNAQARAQARAQAEAPQGSGNAQRQGPGHIGEYRA